MTPSRKIDPPAGRAPNDDLRFALWSLGFRPFYLLAAAFAAFSVPVWLVLYAGFERATTWPPMLWHAHEMVFGFAVAVVTGFLFTAGRNWTGLPTPTGARLAGLCALWLTARIAYLADAVTLALVVELAFLSLVAFALLSVLVRARSRRNYFVGLLFVVLAATDLVFYGVANGSIDAPGVAAVSRAGLYLIATLTIVIGGRVIPMFTANAVRGVRQFRRVWLDQFALAAVVLAFALDLAGVGGAALALVASVASIAQATRLVGWGALATWRNPLVWILHASYAWLAIGLALMAAAALGWVAASLVAHALGVGLVGGLIIGMITRTALGHTGRMLLAGRAETTMFALVQSAALLRVFGPSLMPSQAMPLLTLAAAAWSAAFILYIVVYWPRLSRARVDGREG
ncbi:MAG: NnrS family protein [Burkholderiaceae bacterium]|nr:NnrS family protein [Burkholderiaceae bacterium]